MFGRKVKDYSVIVSLHGSSSSAPNRGFPNLFLGSGLLSLIALPHQDLSNLMFSTITHVCLEDA